MKTKKPKVKKFIPCGEGENICNCKKQSECGYLKMAQAAKKKYPEMFESVCG